MKIKIITLHDSDRENLLVLLSQYETLFLKARDNRKDIIDALYQTFKKNQTNIIFTVDMLLACINNAWQSKEELLPYLKIISTNQLALVGILDVLQNKEGNWPEYNFLEIRPDIDELATICIEIEAERSNFKSIFFSEPDFIRQILTISPTVIIGLENIFLKQLVLSNSAAVSLLEDKKFSHLFTDQFILEDLLALLLVKIESSKSEQSKYILTLLRYFAKHQSRTLSFLIKLLTSPSSHLISEIAFEQIKQTVLDCDEQLLAFLEDYPDFFVPFVERFELANILSKTQQPIKFLTTIMKKNEYITRWLGDHLLLLTAFLLESRVSIRRQEILILLNHTLITESNKKKISFSVLLQEEVKEMLKNLSLQEYSAKELNALCAVLESKEIRESLKLDNPTLQYLFLNDLTSRLLERCIVCDNYSRTDFNSYLKLISMNWQAKKYQYPYMYNCLTLRTTAKSIDFFYTENMNSISAYLVAISDNWPAYKKIIVNAESSQVAKIHPILQLKLQSDSLTNYQFTQALVLFLLKGEMFLMMDVSCQELFCDLASGKQYIAYFAKMQEICAQIHPNDKLRQFTFIRKHNHFIDTIFAMPYYSIKLSAAINRSNLPILESLLIKPEFVAWLDCCDLLNCLAEVNQDQLFIMLKKIAVNKKLVFKFLTHDNNSFYFSRLLSFLNGAQICEILLSSLKPEDFLELANQSEIGLTQFILESEQCKTVAKKLFAAMAHSLHRIKEKKLILFLFSENKYIGKIAKNLKLDEAIQLLLSPSVCSSKKITAKILSQLDKFSFSMNDECWLTSKIFIRNKYAAEFYFGQWELFQKLNYSPELLLSMLIDREFESTLVYLLNDPNLYIFKMIKPIIALLPTHSSQEIGKLLEIHPQSLITDFSLQRLADDNTELSYQNVADIQKKRELIFSLTNTTSWQYKNLVGSAAVYLQLLHLELHQNLDEGLDKLDDYTQLDHPIFSCEYLPITLMLCDKFYEYLLKLIHENPEKLFRYLKSLPHSHKDIRNYFNLTQSIQSLAFIKILNRITFLVIKSILNYVMQVDSDFLIADFIEILAAGAWNYSDQFYQMLENEIFFNKVYHYLYCGHFLFHKNQQPGHILLRLLMLVSLLRVHKITDYLEKIVYELNLFTVHDHAILKEKIFHFFPVEIIQQSDCQQLIGYFLRIPFYTQMLSKSDLLQVTEISPELRKLLFIYPHLRKRFDQEEIAIIATGLEMNVKSKKLAKALKSTVLTGRILQQHPRFNGDNSTKTVSHQGGSFYRLLPILTKSPLPVETRAPRSLIDAVELSHLLYEHCYLPFLNRFLVKFENEFNILTPEARAECIINLALLVLEPFQEDELKIKLEEINNLLTSSTREGLVTSSMIEDWQLEFDYQQISILFYQLIQDELSTITGITINPVIKTSEELAEESDTRLTNRL